MLNGYENYRVFHSGNEFAHGKSHAKRHRERVNKMLTKEFREDTAGEIQLLQFRRFCSTLERMRTRNEVSSGASWQMFADISNIALVSACFWHNIHSCRKNAIELYMFREISRNSAIRKFECSQISKI